VRPLLTGPAADSARARIDVIVSALRDPAVYDADPAFRDSNIGRGSAGAAILFAELGDGETALAFLDSALEGAMEAQPSALLYPGTVGVGWALAYLEGSLVDPDPEENDVDVLAEHALAAGNWPSADLIRGVTGVGVYLLERGRPLGTMVSRLQDMAVELPEGTTWWVDPKTCLPERAEQYPQGYYDVGMAHGQAGNIAILAHALATGEESARPLLEASTAWLLAQRRHDDATGWYPSIVPFERDRDPGGSRTAWCYGDPGVATALVAAGRALGDDKVLREGADLARACAERTEPGLAGIIDAPLCHGSFGLMQVYTRLYEQLEDERIGDAARHWAAHGMTQFREGPVAGVTSARFHDQEERTYEPIAGFLEGATGVALALHAATTDRAYGWDALLLTKPLP
jgi:hypothetical protein